MITITHCKIKTSWQISFLFYTLKLFLVLMVFNHLETDNSFKKDIEHIITGTINIVTNNKLIISIELAITHF